MLAGFFPNPKLMRLNLVRILSPDSKCSELKLTQSWRQHTKAQGTETTEQNFFNANAVWEGQFSGIVKIQILSSGAAARLHLVSWSWESCTSKPAGFDSCTFRMKGRPIPRCATRSKLKASFQEFHPSNPLPSATSSRITFSDIYKHNCPNEVPCVGLAHSSPARQRSRVQIMTSHRR